jgi:hypothetical protein
METNIIDRTFLKSNEKNGASDFELLTKVFTLIASRFKGLSSSLR